MLLQAWIGCIIWQTFGFKNSSTRDRVEHILVREIKAKSILSNSQVYDYALNPDVGCQHACIYCHAKFIKRSQATGSPWEIFWMEKQTPLSFSVSRRIAALARLRKIRTFAMIAPFLSG